MLDREEVEKLGNLAGLAPFVRIPSPAFEELLRVYRAWLDAPQAVASDAEVIALAGGNHWHAKIALLGPAAKELGGQRARLVRDGDSGEGNNNGELNV